MALILAFWLSELFFLHQAFGCLQSPVPKYFPVLSTLGTLLLKQVMFPPCTVAPGINALVSMSSKGASFEKNILSSMPKALQFLVKTYPTSCRNCENNFYFKRLETYVKSLIIILLSTFLIPPDSILSFCFATINNLCNGGVKCIYM